MKKQEGQVEAAVQTLCIAATKTRTAKTKVSDIILIIRDVEGSPLCYEQLDFLQWVWFNIQQLVFQIRLSSLYLVKTRRIFLLLTFLRLLCLSYILQTTKFTCKICPSKSIKWLPFC